MKSESNDHQTQNAKETLELHRLSDEFEVRRLTTDDIGIVYELSRRNELFYQYHPPFVTPESIADDMSALPPGISYEAKFYIGFFKGKNLAAIMDLILGYPQKQTAFIGLFMMNRDLQGKGTGSRIIRTCCSYLHSVGYEKIRLAVDRGNPQSSAFWQKNGFVPTGENTTYQPMELDSKKLHAMSI